MEAHYVLDFVGETQRPDEKEEGDWEIQLDEWNDGEDHSITKMDINRQPRVKMVATKELKLLSGERLGWWSSRKFDRRVRMRALVMGAINDEQTNILLDTGANISAISVTLAKKLRLKRIATNDKQIDVQGIGESKVVTTSRTAVKITLGWEVVYEFEV